MKFTGTERENKLIDLIFSFTMVATKYMHGKSNQEIADWITPQLKILGFPTIPVGMCWGRLIEVEPEKESHGFQIIEVEPEKESHGFQIIEAERPD